MARDSWVSQRSVVAVWSFQVVRGGGLRCAVVEEGPLSLHRAGVYLSPFGRCSFSLGRGFEALLRMTISNF